MVSGSGVTGVAVPAGSCAGVPTTWEGVCRRCGARCPHWTQTYRQRACCSGCNTGRTAARTLGAACAVCDTPLSVRAAAHGAVKCPACRREFGVDLPRMRFCGTGARPPDPEAAVAFYAARASRRQPLFDGGGFDHRNE